MDHLMCPTRPDGSRWAPPAPLDSSVMREEMFAIHSSSSDRELRFLARNGDDFQVGLFGRELGVALEVSAYTDSKGLLALFEKLAVHMGPWLS